MLSCRHRLRLACSGAAAAFILQAGISPKLQAGKAHCSIFYMPITSCLLCHIVNCAAPPAPGLAWCATGQVCNSQQARSRSAPQRLGVRDSTTACDNAQQPMLWSAMHLASRGCTAVQMEAVQAIMLLNFCTAHQDFPRGWDLKHITLSAPSTCVVLYSPSGIPRI